VNGEDFDARLVWNSAPNIDSRDDLDLVVTLPDGQTFLGNDMAGDGVRENVETIEGVHIPFEIINDFEYLELRIVGHQINTGPEHGVVGLNGDKIGFSLAVKGVDSGGVETITPWSIIIQDERVNVEQGGGSLEKYWFAVMIIIVLFIISIIIIERQKISTQMIVEEFMTEGEPSNHEGDSLLIAVAPHIGDDDE
jgi:hypothetical protein